MELFRSIIIAALFIASSGSPIQKDPNSFNAIAKQSGSSLVDIDKDVFLSSGKDGNNFNAVSESNGTAVVQVTGVVHGSAMNRSGEEFNAISSSNGTSDVVLFALKLQGIDPKTKKFDAVSENGGHSFVQIGNVQIFLTPNGALKELGEGAVPESVDGPIGVAWGAVPVAIHNSRPWEEMDDNKTLTINSPNAVHAVVSDLFGNSSNPTPAQAQLVATTEPSLAEETITLANTTGPVKTSTQDGKYSGGVLNAESTGNGSTSIVQVKDSVSARKP